MVFEVDVNGRTHVVSVAPAGSGASTFHVDIDGERQLVDGSRLDDRTMSLIRIDRGGASDVAGIAERGRGELDVYVRGRSVKLLVNGRRRRPGRSEREVGGGEHRIIAPMPGRVVRVLVSPGDDVDARQPLVVVEAMKMANELASPRAGRVKEVAVIEGMSVEVGRLLVVVT